MSERSGALPEGSVFDYHLEQDLNDQWLRVVRLLGNPRLRQGNRRDYGTIAFRDEEGRRLTATLWEEVRVVETDGLLAVSYVPCAEINWFENTTDIRPETAFKRPGYTAVIDNDGVTVSGVNLEPLADVPSDLASADQQSWAYWLNRIETQALADVELAARLKAAKAEFPEPGAVEFGDGVA